MKKVTAILLVLTLVLGLAACGTSSGETTTNDNSTPQTADNSQSQSADTTVITAGSAEKADIESALNLANIKPEWMYSEDADAWTMAIVTAVTNAELPAFAALLPVMDNPLLTFAPGASFLILPSDDPMPLPSLVQRGRIVLPVKS